VTSRVGRQLKRPSYAAALEWLYEHDDHAWIGLGIYPPGTPTLAVSLVGSLFDRTFPTIARDLSKLFHDRQPRHPMSALYKRLRDERQGEEAADGWRCGRCSLTFTEHALDRGRCCRDWVTNLSDAG
jgi:hypothetical protein